MGASGLCGGIAFVRVGSTVLLVLLLVAVTSCDRAKLNNKQLLKPGEGELTAALRLLTRLLPKTEITLTTVENRL